MSVLYQQILHNTALRVSALVGTQVAAINTTYDTAVLTAANFKSADWPFNSFRDSILMAEEMMAEAAAEAVDAAGIGNHPWRASMAGATAALATDAVIPATDSGANRIIGAFGEVVDGTDGKQLTPKPMDLVRRLKAETWRVYPLYHYCIKGRRIAHTRATVVIGVCVYNRVTQLAAWNAPGSILLPDTAEPGMTALAVSLLTKDGAFADQAAQYKELASSVLANLRAGNTPVVHA